MGPRPAVFAVFACALALTACAAPPRGQDPAHGDLLLAGLLIDNASPAFLSSARYFVPATGRFVDCGHIAPGRRCTVAFQERWTGHPVVISWSSAESAGSTGEIELSPDPAVRAAGRAWVRVVIGGPEGATAGLVAPD